MGVLASEPLEMRGMSTVGGMPVVTVRENWQPILPSQTSESSCKELSADMTRLCPG